MENAALQKNAFSNRTRILLILIILLGAILRLHGLASRSIWYDEGCTIAQSRQIDLSFRFFSLDVISDPPVLAAMVRLWESVLGLFPSLQPISVTYDFLLRLLPCVFSIVTLPLIFLVCRLLTANDRAALLATLLAAISPFQVYYAQELKAYSVYLAVSLAAFICFLKALQENRLRYWTGLVFLEALSMYVHFFSAWNIALFNLYFLLTLPRHNRKIIKWAAAQAIVALLILPAVLLAYQWSIVYESISNSWSLRPDAKSIPRFITAGDTSPPSDVPDVLNPLSYSVQPSRHLLETYCSASGAFLIFMLTGSHSMGWPARSAILPNSTTSVSGPA